MIGYIKANPDAYLPIFGGVFVGSKIWLPGFLIEDLEAVALY